MLKTVLSLAVLGSVYYQKKLIQMPQHYQNVNSKHFAYLQHSALLKKPYAVTPWLVNPHLQIIYHTLKQPKYTDLPLSIENVLMPDGGLTQLAWLNLDLAPDTPTIVILHTITGSPTSMQTMLKDLSQATGWRIVMCLRRGHTLEPSTFTHINIMGSVPDLKIQLAHIQAKLPQSPLYAVGSSAGTALLARYLGEVKQDTAFKAAFAYAPGYDLDIAFDRISPLYNWYMAKKIKRSFFAPYQAQISNHPQYHSAMKVKRLNELQKVIFEFAGFSSYDAYLVACNPIHVFKDIAIPTMILNAEDDPICHIDNAKQNLHFIENNTNILLVTTKHGSHCMHYQHWRPRSWAHLLIAEYLLFSHHQSNI